MATLLDIYLKVETLETILATLKKKNEKGISLTLSVSDDSNKWGQNVSAYVSQSKEQREEKAPKFYVGNGRVFWTTGEISKGEKPDDGVVEAEVIPNETDKLPF